MHWPYKAFMRDIDVRNSLKGTKLSKYYLDGTSRVIEEMGLFQGISRIDIAVVNGAMHGFEIKSESDTLQRLETQIHYYSQVFDYLTLIVGSKHLNAVLSNIPEWCGVIEASHKKSSANLKLLQHRSAKRNINVNANALTQLLWRDELLLLLNETGIVGGLSNKTKRQLWDLVANNYSIKNLRTRVRQILKARPDWRVDE